jgi:hypothetical protein
MLGIVSHAHEDGQRRASGNPGNAPYTRHAYFPPRSVLFDVAGPPLRPALSRTKRA